MYFYNNNNNNNKDNNLVAAYFYFPVLIPACVCVSGSEEANTSVFGWKPFRRCAI